MLRLTAEVKDVFLPRLRESHPLRAKMVESAIRAGRGGRLNEWRYGSRMTGTGDRWQAIEDLYEMTCRRVGLRTSGSYGPEEEAGTTFRRPGKQMRLW
jgi:hypothetical protein